jgi:hypothetical protein
MTDEPESIWIDRGPNGGWMFRTEKMPDSVRQYIPAPRTDGDDGELVAVLMETETPSTHWRSAMTELKPCPFCQSAGVELRETVTDAQIACNNCGCRTGLVYLVADDASNAARLRELTEIWNTRAAPEQLLPCMWCGGEMEVYSVQDRSWVTCKADIGTCAFTGPSRPTAAQAIHDYNEVARKVRDA